MRVYSLGHVELKVRNLERSVPFYREVRGFKQVGHHGEKMVFFLLLTITTTWHRYRRIMQRSPPQTSRQVYTT